MEDPFAVLGLADTATLAEVRAARRRLAKELHPDLGGDARRMVELNRAFDLAVKSILRPPPAPAPSPRRSPDPAPAGQRPKPRRPRQAGPPVEQDAPSFTIDVLPAEAFEALLVVGSWEGQILVDDPPYLLDLHLYEPYGCWCRLELVPEAGATMVSVTVAGYDGRRPPPVESVRDRFVALLNGLDPDH